MQIRHALVVALCSSLGCTQASSSSPRVAAQRASLSTPPPAGSWTTLSTTWPVDANMMLLTDGSLLGFAQSGAVYRMTPTSAGQYDTATWNAVASMHDGRLYFGSNVLPDGRVFVVGGEYGTGQGKGEVYDPVANTWTTPFTAAGVADTETALLPDGTVYIAWDSQIYDPATNMLKAGPTYPNGGFDEAGFVLLADQSFLTIPDNTPNAYRYIPAQNKFVDAGTIPTGGLYDSGTEIGPGIRLADGRVLWIGANGKSAIYTPPASASDPGSWVAGPETPSGLMADDAPAALLPNGHVLFIADKGNYMGPAAVFEFDPTGAGSMAASAGAPAPGVAYTCRMLVLPTGQVLLSDGAAGYLYTPGVTATTTWRPTITTVVPKGSGTYELTGTQLHGFNEGAVYGDDAEMASNYPLVRFESSGGSTVTYARTFGWTPTTLGLGTTAQTTQLALPTLSDGSYNLVVVANGIASAPLPVSVAGGNLIVNDFSLNMPSVMVAQGGTATATLKTTRTQGAGEQVALSASGAPTGVTVTLNPAMVSSDNGMSTITVTADATAALGATTFTVKAVGATATHSVDVALDVQSPPDMSQLPDLAPPPDMTRPLDLSTTDDLAVAADLAGGTGGTGGNGGGGNGGGGGGGTSGCSFVAGSTATASAGWLTPALFVLALAFRRRRAALA